MDEALKRLNDFAQADEQQEKRETVKRLEALLTFVNPDITGLCLTDSGKYVNVIYRDGFTLSVPVEGDSPFGIADDVWTATAEQGRA